MLKTNLSNGWVTCRRREGNELVKIKLTDEIIESAKNYHNPKVHNHGNDSMTECELNVIYAYKRRERQGDTVKMDANAFSGKCKCMVIADEKGITIHVMLTFERESCTHHNGVFTLTLSAAWLRNHLLDLMI